MKVVGPGSSWKKALECWEKFTVHEGREDTVGRWWPTWGLSATPGCFLTGSHLGGESYGPEPEPHVATLIFSSHHGPLQRLVVLQCLKMSLCSSKDHPCKEHVLCGTHGFSKGLTGSQDSLEGPWLWASWPDLLLASSPPPPNCPETAPVWGVGLGSRESCPRRVVEGN